MVDSDKSNRKNRKRSGNQSRRNFLAATGALAATGLAGCTAILGDDDSELLSFRDSWMWEGEVSPLVLAQEDGYLEDRGVNVQLRRGHGGAETAREVGTGERELGVASVGATMSVIEEGLDATVIGIRAIPDPSVLVGAEDLDDTIGQTGVHAPGSSSAVIYEGAMADAGYDWEEDVDMETSFSEVDLFMEGEVDFTLTWVTDLGSVWFDQEDPQRPDVYQLANVADIHANCFIAYRPWLEDNEDVAEDFLEAAYAARKWTIENGEEGVETAIDTLLDTYPEQAGGDIATEYHTAALKLFNGGMIMDETVREHGIGYIDEERARDTIEFFEGSLTDGPVDFDDVYYDGLDTRLVESGDNMIDDIDEAEEFYSTIGDTLGLDEDELIDNPVM